MEKTYAAGRRFYSHKAAELIANAKRSIGDVTALTEAKQDFVRLIAEFERITDMLADIEKQLHAMLEEIPMAVQLRSIKGLGPIFVAAILAGAGDLRQYEHGRQLLRKAGLNLAEVHRGKGKDRSSSPNEEIQSKEISVLSDHSTHRN